MLNTIYIEECVCGKESKRVDFRKVVYCDTARTAREIRKARALFLTPPLPEMVKVYVSTFFVAQEILQMTIMDS